MRSKLIMQDQAETVSLAESRVPMDYIVPLTTCAALMVEYCDRTTQAPMLLIAHLASGHFRSREEAVADSELKVYELSKRAKPGTIAAHYWGGSIIRDHGRLNGPDIERISLVLGIKKLDERDRVSTVWVRVADDVRIRCTGRKDAQCRIEAKPVERSQAKLAKKQPVTSGRCCIM